MKQTALFLGTGASLGVPIVGCECETCRSENPKNKRLRSSLLLKVNGKQILIDAGPDLREQSLRFSISHLDGVIFTHAHHDHTAGIDDLRIFYFRNKAPVPCLLSQETAKDIKMRFYFMFEPDLMQAKQNQIDTPHPERLALQILPGDEGVADFLGIPMHYFTYLQIGMKIIGIRIGNFAYVTDIKDYNETIFQHLRGVEILVLSALRHTSTHMHLTVDEAVDFIKKIAPKKAFLTHISHELEHEKTNAILPPNIKLAYDGLEIPLP